MFLTILGPHHSEPAAPSLDHGVSKSVLKPIHHKHEGYRGCLDMTEDELKSYWKWPGNMPVCDGGVSDSSTYGEGSGGGNDSNYSGGSSGGGGGGGDGSSGGGDSESDESIYGRSFDLADCQTYSNLWLWDLALSCEDVETLSGCSCTFASELLEGGTIGCASSSDSSLACPEGCSVCETCMTLHGCEDIYTSSDPFGEFSEAAKDYTWYMLASTFGILAGAVALFLTGRKTLRWRRDRMGASSGLPNELIQSSPPAVVSIGENEENRVWLAPLTL